MSPQVTRPIIPPPPPEFAPTAAGMTLRDWFAGQALAGMMADHEGKNRIGRALKNSAEFAPRMASLCYLMADAMLAAREGKQ